jgi:hypothetical protein
MKRVFGSKTGEVIGDEENCIMRSFSISVLLSVLLRDVTYVDKARLLASLLAKQFHYENIGIDRMIMKKLRKFESH